MPICQGDLTGDKEVIDCRTVVGGRIERFPLIVFSPLADVRTPAMQDGWMARSAMHSFHNVVISQMQTLWHTIIFSWSMA